MKKPKRPALPTTPSKPYDAPKTKAWIVDHIPTYSLHLVGAPISITKLIEQLQAIAHDRDPDNVMLNIRQEYGYYNESHIEVTCTEQKEIDNPHYDKQLVSFNKSMVGYEAKLAKHKALMKQYHIDIEQYDYDMKAYYDWVVAQKKEKGK